MVNYWTLKVICMLELATVVVYARQLNDRPLIGILAQESDPSEVEYGDTYIPANYVQYLELAGARTVPIRVKENQNYYETIFNGINGIVFPGGGVSIFTSEYAVAGRVLYKLAIEASEKGDYFPLWGVCQGFELMTAMTCEKNVLAHSDAEDYMVPLVMAKGYRTSKMFGNIPADVLNVVTKWNVTANFHQECLTPKNFTENSALSSFYQVLSTNSDKDGIEYISTMEARKYPFYATQWHPEKNIFMWDTRKHPNHSAGAVRVSQYFSDFFVNEARKSSHHFPNEEVLSQALFYNYHPVYFGAPSFIRSYFFSYTSKEMEENANGYGAFLSKDKLDLAGMLSNIQVVFLMTAGLFGVFSLLMMARRFLFGNKIAADTHPHGYTAVAQS